MRKKGLNDAITTVLFIVLVLIAIATVWYFVRPLLFSASQLTSSGDCINLQIEPLACTYIQTDIGSLVWNSFGGHIYYVEAKRGAGSGDIAGMRYVFEDAKGKLYTYDWNGSDAYPPRVSALPQPLDVVSNIFVETNEFTPIKVSVAPLLLNKKTYCEPSGGFVECSPAITYQVGADISGSLAGRCDGGTDINDLLYFLQAFDEESPGADLAPQPIPDGRITPEDLSSFLAAFERGTGGECPFAPH